MSRDDHESIAIQWVMLITHWVATCSYHSMLMSRMIGANRDSLSNAIIISITQCICNSYALSNTYDNSITQWVSICSNQNKEEPSVPSAIDKAEDKDDFSPDFKELW